MEQVAVYYVELTARLIQEEIAFTRTPRTWAEWLRVKNTTMEARSEVRKSATDTMSTCTGAEV